MNVIESDSADSEKSIALLERITSRSKARYLQRLTEIKARRIIGSAEEWNVYNSGLEEHFAEKSNWTTFHGIGGYNKDRILEEINQKRETLHATGKKMMVVEHFGQGRVGMELRADKVIISGLTEFSGVPKSIVEQEVGDALDEDTSNNFEHRIRKAKSEGYALPLIIFRPVGGLSINSLNLYAFRRLYSQLRTAYELLDDDGLLFIGSFGSGIELKFLQRMLKRTGCNELLLENSTSDAIGIRKNNALCSTLPSEIEWAQVDQNLVRELIALDTLDARNVVGTRPRVRERAGSDRDS